MNREELIDIGIDLKKINNVDELVNKYAIWRDAVIGMCGPEDRADYKIALHIGDSPFESNEQKIKQYEIAIDRTIELLKKEDTGIKPITTIIENFSLFLQNMFAIEPDKKATLKSDVLNQIEINNEYDIQHMMYAVVKALYPHARREVTQDIGYGFDRYDIAIDEIDTVVEIKCSRKDHSDKKLLRELGEDAFFYKCSNLIMYVYDKHNVIRDTDNFIRALEKTKYEAGKKIKVVINQANRLI